MKKLTRNSLDELAQRMPVLSEELQRSFIGGGGGSKDDPYSQREYDAFILSGYFPGGYVDLGGIGSPYYLGAASGETTITNGKNPKPDHHRDAGGDYSLMYQGGYEKGYAGEDPAGILSGILYLATGEIELLYMYRGYQRGKEDRERNFVSYY